MKKIICNLILILFFVVAITPPIYAQDQDDSAGITLTEAVEMALKTNNSIKQIEYDIERGEEVRKSALDKLSYIPSGQAEPQVAAAWTGLLATDIGLQMTKKGKEVEIDKIKYDVFKKYTDVLSSLEKLELAKLQLENAERNWRVTLISFDTGIISQSQLKSAEYGTKTAKTSYEAAAKEADKAYQNFNYLIGLSAQDRPLLTEEIEFAPIQVDNLDSEVHRIMDGNPAIWQAEQQVTLAEIQLDLYNWADPMREPYDAKKIDIEKAELSTVEGKMQMKNALYNIYNGIILLEDNYVITEQALKMAQEDYRVKKLQYDVGMISKQDYLQSELALAKAENDFNQIVYQHEALKQSFYKPWTQI